MRKISLIAAAVAMTASSVYADIQVGKGLNVGGYLNMTYDSVHNDNAVKDTAGFTAQNAEIDFKMDFSKGLTARVDLDSSFDKSSAATIAATKGNMTSFEQVRIDYAFGESSITLGKFDTFVGLEALEAPELYQISKSYTSELTPSQNTGAQYMYNGGVWNAAVALVNDYAVDNGNASATGDKKELSYIFHVGIKPVKAFALNVNYARDNQSAAVPSDSDIWTIDGSYSNHGWTVGAEYVNGSTEAAFNDTEVDAWMLMANYMFTEQFGLTARYSASKTDANVVKSSATIVDKDEWALAASYAVTPNWSNMIEYRIEKDDKSTAAAGIDKNTIALESILTF